MIRYLASLFLTLGLGLPLLAQDPQTPEIQGEPPEAPATNAELGDTLIRENLEYLALSGNDLAGLYRKYTGRRVIVASAASKAVIRAAKSTACASTRAVFR